jgi:TRAP-type C4-dicarboxylate transport system substrate-binding protein
MQLTSRMQWLAAAALAAVLAGPAQAQQLTFRLGTVDAQQSHSGVGSEAFAAAVARLSNNQMRVQVFHAGQLGAIPEQQRNVMSGAQDMHLLYPEFLDSLIEETRVIAAPYVFRNHAHQQAFFRSELFRPALERIRQLGAVVIDQDWTWWQMDPRGVIAVRPIRTLQDLQGLRLRIWESRTAIATWRGLGANTIVVPRPEMYLAFQQGIIEGGPETIGIAVDQRNAELAKFWTRTDEYFQIVNVMMNARRWDALTEEQRTILRQAAREGGEAYRRESERGFTEKRQRAEREFHVTVIEADLGPWRERAQAIVQQLEADGNLPRGLVARVQALQATN